MGKPFLIVELPPQAKTRLETIAALAVRMRETVRQLSEEYEAQASKCTQEKTPPLSQGEA